MNKMFKTTSRNNKGVALVTVVIAVAFISIIGTALLSIAYTNFQMKVLNLNSKQNFYETDGELVKITAGIRNSVEKPDDLDDLLSSKSFVQDLTDPNLYTAPASAVKLNGANGILDKSGLWDVTNNCIASHDNEDTFEYTVGGATKYTSGSITTYTINDLKVKQISKDGGYTNTVQTDLQIKVLEQTGGASASGGLGNCSMLMDSNMEVTATDVSFVSFMGNTYCAKYEDSTDSFAGSGTYTVPGKWDGTFDSMTDYSTWPFTTVYVPKPNGVALNLTQNAKVNVEGENLVVYGDIVLANNSCLYVSSGKLKVFGDIYILDNATLICGGEIYMPESDLPGRSGKPCCIKSAYGTAPASADYLKKHVIYSGDIEPISDADYKEFCDLLQLSDADLENDGIVAKISKKVKLPNNKEVTIFDSTNNSDKISSDFYGVDCGIAVMMPGNVGNLDQYTNYLVFVTDHGDPDGTSFNMNATNVHSTFVSRSSIYLNTQNGIYYTKMGPELYDYLTIDDPDNKYYDPALHNFSLWLDTTKGQGTVADLSISDLLEDKTNKWINDLFNVGSGDMDVKSYINSATFHNYVKDAD